MGLPIDKPRLGLSNAVYASDAARKMLCRNGLADIDAVFSKGASAPCRHEGRSVWKVRLTSEHDEPVSVFVKMHWGRRRFWPRMADLKTGQVFQSQPVREWHGLHRLESIGLHVPERLALFRHGLLMFRSAVIVRAVPPKHSLYDMIQNGRWERLSTGCRESLLDAVVSTIRKIHAAGYGWRGTSSKHFYPELHNDDTWKLWLIDCEGVHGRATQRTFQRDFRKFSKCLKLAGADQKTRNQLKIRIKP